MKIRTTILAAAMLPLFALPAMAQKKQTPKKTVQPYDVSASGVKYKMLKDEKGTQIKNGDIVEFNLVNRNSKDSVLFDTYQTGSPLPIQIADAQYKGDLMDALKLLSAGDSAVFWFPVDSLKDFEPIPGVLDKGTFMHYTVKINGIYTPDEFKAKMAKAGSQQLQKDTVEIVNYLKSNKIKDYKSTGTGLYYVIDKKGPDANAKPTQGKKVKVHYVGTLLNGQKFDSSRDRNEPFEFTLGVGQVIPGWDQGIALLSKGTRARLFIPSPLGYGPQGAGAAIPANSILVFDVELIDF